MNSDTNYDECFSIMAFSFSFEAPTSSSILVPLFHTWKVGIAVTPATAATACDHREVQRAPFNLAAL